MVDRPKRNKIAVVGYTSHKTLAPWTDNDWEIFGLNDLYLDLPIFQGTTEPPFDRIRWFQIHPWQVLRDWAKDEIRPGDMLQYGAGPAHPRDPGHLIWLKEASKLFPVYMKDAREEFPDALVYPRDAVYEYFGRRYFTNSITWMLGLAIMELAPNRKAVKDAEIGVWGVDMMVAGSALDSGSEYGYQRPSCEWILGYAEGLGIKVRIPDQSDLLKSAYDYGDDNGDSYFRNRLRGYMGDAEQRRIQAVNMRTSARDQEMQCVGANSACEWLFRAHLPGDSGALAGQVSAPDGHKIPQGG